MGHVNPGLVSHDGNVTTTNGMGAGGSLSPTVGMPVLGGNDVAITSRFGAGSGYPMTKNP
jgi:hypothetical protein